MSDKPVAAYAISKEKLAKTPRLDLESFEITKSTVKFNENLAYKGSGLRTILQICNISSLDFYDFEIPPEEAPDSYGYILIISLILFAIPGNIRFFGLAGFIFFIYLIAKLDQKNALQKRFGLLLTMNSGESVIVGFKRQAFLIEVIDLLYTAMKSPNFIESKMETNNYVLQINPNNGILIDAKNNSKIDIGTLINYQS